jgi:hypothetical protein
MEAKAGRVAGLEQEVTDLKACVKIYEDAEKAAKTEAISSLLNAAVADVRIKEPQRAAYTVLLEKDFESAKPLFERLPHAQRVMKAIQRVPMGKTKLLPRLGMKGWMKSTTQITVARFGDIA